MSDSRSKIVIYKGPSMNPTFKNADILEVVPYNERKVKRGDVITFMPLNGEISITHRVISVNAKGVRTLGDNNSNVDEGYIQPKDIIGHVIYAQRSNRRLYVCNGMLGRLYAIVIRLIRQVNFRHKRVLILLRPIYLYLCRLGIFRWCISPEKKLKVFSFTRPNGVELQLIWGRRIIGRLAPGASQWSIKIPFRLFIDVELLPKHEKDQIVDFSESKLYK